MAIQTLRRPRRLGVSACGQLLGLVLLVPLLVPSPAIAAGNATRVISRAPRSRQGTTHRTGPAEAGKGKEVN